MLTKKQHELLSFLHMELEKKGVSPSFDEMKVALNLRSKSGIHRLISALEERGFVRRLPHRARAIEILKLPEFIEPIINSNVIRPNFLDNKNKIKSKFTNEESILKIPLYGRIAAGTPIEALNEQNNTIDIPINLISSGDHYALEVEGDSMIDAGIFDGDTVLIKRTHSAENGSIVVALIDDNEATLKRLNKRNNSIELLPENKLYDVGIFDPQRVQIQGKLVGLIRRY